MKDKNSKIMVIATKLFHSIGQPHREKGQSIIILTFAFVGMLALMGLALDAGLIYVNRVRLARAVDAAVLAGVVELPSEEEAVLRSAEFLMQNGYDDANIYVAGCLPDYGDKDSDGNVTEIINFPGRTELIADLKTGDNKAYAVEVLSAKPALYQPLRLSANPSAPNFYIDTRSYQIRDFDENGNTVSGNAQCNPTVKAYGSASKIRVFGDTPVKMNFMQFFNRNQVNVNDKAVAQNASNLDVVVSLDRTGSMMFDTICLGCWKRCGGTNDDRNTAACVANDKYKDYPTNGRAYPLDFEAIKSTYICGNGGNCTTTPITPGQAQPITGTNYIVLEAELYSNNANSIWDPSFRGQWQGYWAMQRNGTNITSPDAIPAYVRHHPFYATSDTYVPLGKRYILSDAQANTSPRLEYDFKPTWSGNTYIYLKMQTFDGGDRNNRHPDYSVDLPQDAIYWAIDNGAVATDAGQLGANANYARTCPTRASDTSGSRDGWGNTDSNGDDWCWIKLGTSDQATGTSATTTTNLNDGNIHTLKIWAGSPGYSIDRIIIAGTTSWDTISEVVNSTIDTDAATPGTARRVAADKCNPIYGLSVVATDCRSDGWLLSTTSVNNLNDPLFGDRQPIRGAKEAVKAFVERLDPSLDQAGFVRFNDNAQQMAQLECLQGSAARAAFRSTQVANYPIAASVMGEFDELECYNPETAASGTKPIEYRNVLIGIEEAFDSSATDIADGLRRSLHMFGINTDTDDGSSHANTCLWTYNGSTWLIGGVDQSTAPAATTSHCSRGAAATQVLVLLTDGAPTDGSPGDTNGDGSQCNATATSPLPYAGFPDSDSKYRCIMYYTKIAANNGIVIYTIGLGSGADPDLLGAVAAETNGQYYYAPSSAQLNIIFSQILANIYVRIVE